MRTPVVCARPTWQAASQALVHRPRESRRVSPNSPFQEVNPAAAGAADSPLSRTLGGDGRAQPALDLVQHAGVDLRLRRAGALRHLEGMIAALDHIELRFRFELAEHRAELVGGAEGVALALDDEHRHRYCR